MTASMNDNKSENKNSDTGKSGSLDLINILDISAASGVSWGLDGGSLAVVNKFGSLVTIFDTKDWVKRSEFSRNGGDSAKCVFFLDKNHIIVQMAPETEDDFHYFAEIFDIYSGKIVGRLKKPDSFDPGSRNQVGACDLSADRTMFAISSRMENKVAIYNTNDWSLISVNEFHERGPQITSITAIRFFNEEKRFAVSTLGGIFVSDIGGARNDSAIMETNGEIGSYRSLAISGNNEYIFAGRTPVPERAEDPPVDIFNISINKKLNINRIKSNGVNFVQCIGVLCVAGLNSNNSLLFFDHNFNATFQQMPGRLDPAFSSSVYKNYIAITRGNSVVVYRVATAQP